MKKLLLTFLAIASTAAMIGCSKSGGDSNAACASYSGGYCVDANGNIVGSNGMNQYYDYKFYFNFATGEYLPYATSSLTITDTGAYKAFLKEAMAVCDTSTWSWGGSSCDAWTQGSLQLAIYMDSSNKPFIDIRAVPAQTYWTGSFGFFTGGATLNPLQLYSNTTFSLINNSQGFEIRTYGSSWNGGGLKLIQIQVANGKMGDGSFTYKLIYPSNGVATTFATGSLKKF